MAWHEPPLFPGWGPDLVRPAALWPTVDPGEVGLDEQARWIWPDAVGPGGTSVEPGSWSESWAGQQSLPAMGEAW